MPLKRTKDSDRGNHKKIKTVSKNMENEAEGIHSMPTPVLHNRKKIETKSGSHRQRRSNEYNSQEMEELQRKLIKLKKLSLKTEILENELILEQYSSHQTEQDPCCHSFCDDNDNSSSDCECELSTEVDDIQPISKENYDLGYSGSRMTHQLNETYDVPFSDYYQSNFGCMSSLPSGYDSPGASSSSGYVSKVTRSVALDTVKKAASAIASTSSSFESSSSSQSKSPKKKDKDTQDRVQCPHCFGIFNKSRLNQHMNAKHSSLKVEVEPTDSVSVEVKPKTRTSKRLSNSSSKLVGAPYELPVPVNDEYPPIALTGVTNVSEPGDLKPMIKKECPYCGKSFTDDYIEIHIKEWCEAKDDKSYSSSKSVDGNAGANIDIAKLQSTLTTTSLSTSSEEGQNIQDPVDPSKKKCPCPHCGVEISKHNMLRHIKRYCKKVPI